MKPYSVADLFSGCGGFTLGFDAARDFSLRVAVDAWQQALDTLHHNLPDPECLALDLSDPKQIDIAVESIGPDLDVLLGGPPCQGFSTLGKRRDGDRRSTLVDSFAEVCVRARPKFVIVENVKGITTKKHPSHPSYADALLDRLASQYECSTQVLNAVDYGIPQNRIRWFLIGVRRDIPNARHIASDFWRRLSHRATPHLRTLKFAIADLPKLGPGEEAHWALHSDRKRGSKLHNHRAMRHSPELVARLAHIPKGGGLLDVPTHLLTPHLKKMVNGEYGSGGHVKNIYGRMDWDRPSGTIVAGIDKITCGRFVHPEDNRLLTPRECARIQTFPDDFEFLGGQVAQYYQIGNAVPPKLAQLIAETLITALKAYQPHDRHGTRHLELL